jgi:hypothetical protein
MVLLALPENSGLAITALLIFYPISGLHPGNKEQTVV